MTAEMVCPGNTAIKRRAPSLIARTIMQHPFISELEVASVLDFGCGWGADVQHYQRCGLRADGYDPDPRFNSTELPRCLYDLVTMIYVLNVVPTLALRHEAVANARQLLRPGGVLLLATRSALAVQREAVRNRWAAWGDGYVSHKRRRTFQRGHASTELEEILITAKLVPLPRRLHFSNAVAHAMGRLAYSS